MAATAETLERQTHEFDWDFAEAQFAASVNCERPPEAEIYGRSLSTIHRMGRFMIGKALPEVTGSPEAEQAKAEFYTSVEEGFGTDVELGGGLEVRDFDVRPVVDGRVMAKDLKTAVSDMTGAGLMCAVETAEGDRRFLPQLTRSKWDHENAMIVDSMARGETNYNTRIVISPFPEEAAAKSGDAYWRGIGYVPHLRRGFVQLYHVSEKGLVAGSLSFDGSDKERLRELFSKCGLDIPETEITDNWLQYAITDTLSESEAKELAIEIANQAADPRYKKTINTVEVTSAHRAIMDTVFNESYVHVCESLFRGRQTSGVRELVLQFADKARHFNRRYRDALYRMRANGDRFTDDDSVVLHELLVYSTIEMMRSLHLRATEPRARNGGFYGAGIGHVDIVYLQSLDSSSFQEVLGGFGAEGALNNRGYSACGLEISPGETNGSDKSPQRIFGGEKYSFDRKMYCLVCQAPPKDNDKPKWCGPCGICRSCDNKIQAKNSS